MIKLTKLKIGCVVFLGFLSAITVRAQTFTTLADFERSNGGEPWYMSLTQGIDGAFYGTTEDGGSTNGCGQFGCGTVFRITPGGILTALHLSSSAGSNPVASLTLVENSLYYGVALENGAFDAGTIFEVTSAHQQIAIYSFCSQPNCADGDAPAGKLLKATDGNLYGTTWEGGANPCAETGNGCGTIFRITPEGSLLTLYNFCTQTNCADGSKPLSGLIESSDGIFYGTTAGEGLENDQGTVFRVTANGKLTTLYNFCSLAHCADGSDPVGELVQGKDGAFYGTTVTGGTYNGGTVFRITEGGTLTTLYSFCSQSNCADGAGPYSGLVQATDGNFYGTTVGGGFSNQGTVYKITSNGVLTVFTRFGSGYLPVGGLLQGTDGRLYGTTALGGDLSCDFGHGCGTIFSLDMGLGPFVSFVQPFGRVGQTGGILGQGFTGTTAVSLNGTPVNFTVVSDTYLTATVPPGATTGYVTVTTPSGVLTSNVPFHVIP